MADFNVSVITPVYNAAPYVRKAVESALQQPETGEVILIEDASPDSSLEICRHLDAEYEKVRLLQHPDKKNHGAGASRNLGIKAAKYPYIAFLDADDFYLPNRFSEAKKIMMIDESVDGVYEAIGYYFYRDENSQLNKKQQRLTTIDEPIHYKDLFYKISPIGDKGYFSLNGLVLKSESFCKIGFFNPKLLIGQDTDIILKMTLKLKLVPGRIKDAVAMRGVHEKNRSSKENIIKYEPLIFKELIKWSAKNQIQTDAINRFIYLYFDRLKRKLHGITKPKLFFSSIILAIQFPKLIRLEMFKQQLSINTGWYHIRKYFSTKKKNRKMQQARKVIIGAGDTTIKGWQPTNINTLDVLKESDFAKYWSPNSLDRLLAEHVWEYFTGYEASIALSNCHKYLKKNGVLRIAVPDGYLPDKKYQKQNAPGKQPIALSPDNVISHQVVYTYQSLSSLLQREGFFVKLLEYWDEKGNFHSCYQNDNNGIIKRSYSNDPRNADGKPHYTSLIIDAIKK